MNKGNGKGKGGGLYGLWDNPGGMAESVYWDQQYQGDDGGRYALGLFNDEPNANLKIDEDVKTPKNLEVTNENYDTNEEWNLDDGSWAIGQCKNGCCARDENLTPKNDELDDDWDLCGECDYEDEE